MRDGKYYSVIISEKIIMSLCRRVCVCERDENPYQGDSREDLQQGNQVVSIPQVLIQVCDVLPHLREEVGEGARRGKEGSRKDGEKNRSRKS